MTGSIWDYSTTPGSNTAIAGINIAPGCPSSSVGPAMREILADVKGSLLALTAGGTADAITASLSPAPAALTDGMRVWVRAGAANATTTPTFQLNVLGAAGTIKKLGGNALVPGDVSGAGHLIELEYVSNDNHWELLNPAKPSANGIANAQLAQAPANTLKGNNTGSTANVTDLTTAQVLALLGISAPSCGRLAFVSATQIKFSPFNGAAVQIAGVLYAIPSGGITAANTSVFVNGVGGSNLAASTLYYVYLFNNSGTLTPDFSTTPHATDTAAGNIGVEIKSGDNTRTLIGMVFTNASAQFEQDNALLGVRSWFNRPALAAAQITSASGYGNAPMTGIGTVIGVTVFADDLVTALEGGVWQAGSVAGGTVQAAILVDGSNVSETAGNNLSVSNLGVTITSSITRTLSEGHHTLQMGLATISLGAVGTINLALDVGVR